MFNAGQRVNFVFNSWRHKSREPPSHHLGPKCWVHDIKCFQVLLVSKIKKQMLDSETLKKIQYLLVG